MQVHAPLPRVAVGHRETVAGGLPRLREWETCPNSLQSTNTPPKFPTPNSPSPAPAIQVGYKAGTVLSPPPCRVLGVSWWRGPKSSQMLCQEPQTLVTSLILGKGLGGGPQLLQVLCWETPPPILACWGQTGTKPLALLVLESRAGAAGGFLGADLLERGSE